jgi:hypothetical protein
MIPRHQTVLFVILLVASAIMSIVLWNQLRRAHERLLRGDVSAPTRAPQVAPTEQATLMVADDADNSVRPRSLILPLPDNPEARARAVLGKLFELDAAPDATHPVPGAAGAVAQVFLLPIADHSGKTSVTSPELAVVNLSSAFVSGHPSGIETETLTIRSICGTLKANLPRVTEVSFLVDGQPHPTLSGHADLTRTYLTDDETLTGRTQP